MPRPTPDADRRLRLVRGADDDQDDAHIVRALTAGEPWAAAATWHRYGPNVYRLFRRALGPTTDCEDLTQEVFAGVFAHIGRLRDPGALRSFIYSCAVRRLRSHLRGRRLRSLFPLFSPNEMPERAAPEPDLDGRKVLARFYRALDRLPADDRTAYVLRYLEGLRLSEVAAAAGVSLATAKRRIARGVARIAAEARHDPLLSEYLVRPGEDDGD